MSYSIYKNDGSPHDQLALTDNGSNLIISLTDPALYNTYQTYDF